MPTPPSLTWFDENPHIQSVRSAACDLNGIPRGKRMPMSTARKVLRDGTRFPFSAVNVDIWGHDIEDSPLVFDSGDQDATLRPTERGPVPMPWLSAPAALLPIAMYHENGKPFGADPRHALAQVVDRFADLGLTPVVALEMEFYLVDDSEDVPRPPAEPLSGKRRWAGDVLSLSALDAFDGFFTELYAAADAMGIPADTAISESGAGQFEINLVHCDDVLRAADDAWFFKLLVKGLARRHGFAASFAAKPYADQPGSGMHAHFSLLDKAGQNVFDDGGSKGTDTLRHAIGGCANALIDSTLIFAPHENSFHRLVPGAHAPSCVSWAYENRTVALRVPSGAPSARRLEHRLAGADANPYLALAAVLGAALLGITDRTEPPAPVSGNAYAQDLPRVAPDWASAIDRFETAPTIARIFPKTLIDCFVRTKRQELHEIKSLSKAERVALYLETL